MVLILTETHEYGWVLPFIIVELSLKSFKYNKMLLYNCI